MSAPVVVVFRGIARNTFLAAPDQGRTEIPNAQVAYPIGAPKP